MVNRHKVCSRKSFKRKSASELAFTRYSFTSRQSCTDQPSFHSPRPPAGRSLSLPRLSLSFPNTCGRRAGGSPCLATCGWKEHGGEQLAVRHGGSEPPPPSPSHAVCTPRRTRPVLTERKLVEVEKTSSTPPSQPAFGTFHQVATEVPHSGPWARLILDSIRLPFRPPVCEPYTIQYW